MLFYIAEEKNMFILIILLFIALILVLTNMRIVNQGYVEVLERLGQYKTVWTPGFHVKVPFIERVVRRVTVKEQVLDFPPQPVITKDNVTMQIDSVVFMKVFDAKLYTYGMENPIAGLQNLSATTLRNIIGEMELDQTLTSRDEINRKMQATLDAATDPWGIKVTRVEIKNIQPPKEIEEVMTKQMRAERERRQTVLEAKAHQESVVARAEGDKTAKILAAQAERDAQVALAEGRAKSIRMVYEAQAAGIADLSRAGITENVLRLRSIDVLKDVADGRATKIYMPSEIADTIARAGLVGESLGIGDAEPIDKSPKPRKPAAADPCIGPESSPETIGAAATGASIAEDLSSENRDFTATDKKQRNY